MDIVRVLEAEVEYLQHIEKLSDAVGRRHTCENWGLY